MKGKKSAIPITISSRAHNNRTLGGVRVASKAECLHFIKMGFSIQRSEFELRRPEQMISDLANPQHPISRMSAKGILAYHDSVKRLLKGSNYERHQIIGDNLDTELAVHASSATEAKFLKDKIHREAIDGLEIELEKQFGSWDARGLERSLPLEASDANTLMEYQAIKREIEDHYHTDFLEYLSVSNIDTLYRNHLAWSALRSLGFNYVFVLNSGLRLYLSMINAVDVPSATFVEVHRENDESELFRKRDIEVLERGSIDINRPFVVVDIAYTGGTVRAAAKLVEKIYGENISVITVGVFPKTLEAVTTLDYCIYGGRLLRTRDLSPTRSSWVKELLCQDETCG